MTIGGILKKRRLEKHRSIDDVALKLKINSRKIQALENNDWGKLPAFVYTRGYLKKYADYLGLNQEKVLNQYKQEVSVEDNLVVLPSIKNQKFVLSPKTAILFTVIIFFGLVTIYLASDWIALASPPSIILFSPVEDFVTLNSEIIISGKTNDGNNKLTINEIPVYPDDNGNFEVTNSLKEGLNTIEVKATNILGKETVIYRQVLFQHELQ